MSVTAIPMLPSRLPKPYIRRTPNLRVTERPMTIAATFKCRDGVVLAADTQISHWQSYSYETKIIDLSCAPDWNPRYMAYAGDVATVKEIKEDVQNTFAETQNPDHLAKNLKTTFKRLHNEHFSKAPRTEKTELQAFIAFPSDDQKWQLYCAWGSKFYPITSYELLGIGTDTGNAIWNPLFNPELCVSEMAVLAADGLGIVKRFVKGCGGKSDIWELTDDLLCAESKKLGHVEELEKGFLSLEGVQSRLLSSLWTFDSTRTFQKNFRLFGKELHIIRRRKEKQLREELKRKLERARKMVSSPT